MFCPQCGITNPPEAARCDCGWDFQHLRVMESYAPPGQAPLASLGDRFAAELLDTVIAFVPLLAGAALSAVSETAAAIMALAGIGFAVFYLLFADGFASGQSYGKRLMGTAVVDATTGKPCTYGQSFGRNFLLAILGFIDWIFIFGQRRQRIGDRAAGTIVVKRRS